MIKITQWSKIIKLFKVIVNKISVNTISLSLKITQLVHKITQIVENHNHFAKNSSLNPVARKNNLENK